MKRDTLVLAPMRMEARALRRGLGAAPGTLVVHTGVGPRRSARFAATPGLGSYPLVVAGIAGGLSPELQPGDIVVATRVEADPGLADRPAPVDLPDPDRLAEALRRLGLAAELGPVVSTPKLVSAAWRRRLLASGALAVDMESAWLLCGSRTGEPRACVRVVADPAGVALYSPATVARVRTALRTLMRLAPALRAWAHDVDTISLTREVPPA